MRVSFVTNCENTPEFLNLVKLLLFSFRKNAGIYKDSQFTITINSNSLEKSEAAKLTERYSPINIVTMPPLGGVAYNNKYNSLYAVDPESYDILIYLDYDTAILAPLDGIIQNINLETPIMKAREIGKKGNNSVWNYHNLIKRYCLFSDYELNSFKDNTLRSYYPLFNAGIFLMNNKAVLLMRDDILKISYQLYNEKLTSFNPQNIVTRTLFNAYRILNKRADYKIWMSEQLAFSIALMKNNVNYEMLDSKYNKYKFEDNIMPSIFHYLSFKKKMDRKNLFNGDWYIKYIDSKSYSESSLAKLILSYNQQYSE